MQTMLAPTREALRVVDEAGSSTCPRRAARRALLTALAGWEKIAQARFPAKGYERFLLFTGRNRPLSAWAFLWAPGAATPIHDHRCWCVAGVVAGQLVEERYAVLPSSPGTAGGPASPGQSGGRAMPLARIRLDAGMVSALEAGPRGTHRVLNESDAPALTIHVYGFDPEEAASSIDRSYQLEGILPGRGTKSDFYRRLERE